LEANRSIVVVVANESYYAWTRLRIIESSLAVLGARFSPITADECGWAGPWSPLNRKCECICNRNLSVTGMCVCADWAPWRAQPSTTPWPRHCHCFNFIVKIECPSHSTYATVHPLHALIIATLFCESHGWTTHHRIFILSLAQVTI
jgi:hypothetical protein